MATEKGLEEGEKEMEMMSAKVSGGCGLAGPVRVMWGPSLRGGAVCPGPSLGRSVGQQFECLWVTDWLCARSFLPPSTFSFVEIHFLLNPFYYSLSRPVSLIFDLSVRFTSLSLLQIGTWTNSTWRHSPFRSVTESSPSLALHFSVPHMAPHGLLRGAAFVHLSIHLCIHSFSFSFEF